ncbi:MAG: chemotaxis protein CheW [Desulfobacteraceae bacterium]
MSRVYDDNTIQEFVAENRDHLEQIEPDLLIMEKGGADIPQDLINRVFRAVHSIKGSSGFFDFQAIKDLSHVMESVLMLIREGRLAPDQSNIDALLASVDKLRIMFADVEGSGHVPYQNELDRLNAILDSAEPKKEPDPPHYPRQTQAEPFSKGEDRPGPCLTVESPAGAGPPEARFEPQAREWAAEALGNGNYLYLLWYTGKECDQKDLEGRMNDYGQVFGPGRSSDRSADAVPYLFATVMEPDLLSGALGLPMDRVVALEGLPEQINATAGGLSPGGSAPKEGGAHSSRGCPFPKEDGTSYDTIRVHVELIDKLMNLAGELVLGRNQLRQELGEASTKTPKLATLIKDLNAVTSEVQEKIIQMRMQPVGNLFNKFTRVIRDLAHRLGKEVELSLEGGEVELDKSILEGLSDPVTHLVRNCLDHGLESPEERRAAGKPSKGRLKLNAFQEGGQVNITIIDDGRGIDPGRVAGQAVSKGKISGEAVRRMTDKEKVNLIFMPGFSTAEAVSDISGRGVGMDVVKTNIERLGGHLEVESAPGRGSSVRIRLPLTLAIIPSLIVGAGGFRFAVPQINVKELVCIRAREAPQRIEEAAGAEVLRLRGALLPLVRLSRVLGIPGTYVDPESGEVKEDRRENLADRRGRKLNRIERTSCFMKTRRSEERRQNWRSDLYVVVLALGENRFGLCVEQLFDTEEIVVKPLSDHIKGVKCFAGATIMGDGRVAMILDAAGIASFCGLRFAEISAEEQRRRKADAARDETRAQKHRAVLLFKYARNEQFALPLESISRLEKIDKDSVQVVGNLEYMDYRGKGLPLMRLDRLIPVSPLPEDLQELYVIIPKTVHPKAGILASGILDAMEISTPVRPTENGGRGLSGSAFVEGKLTLFLDPESLLRAAGAGCEEKAAG